MRKLGIIFWLGTILLNCCSANAEQQLAEVVDEVGSSAESFALASTHSQALSAAKATPAAQSDSNCDNSRDCCPSWANYLEVDYLMLSRSNGLGNQPLVLDSLTRDQVLMDTQDFGFGLAPGLRVVAGQRRDSGPGWEIGYTGIYNAFAEQAFSGGRFQRLET